MAPNLTFWFLKSCLHQTRHRGRTPGDVPQSCAALTLRTHGTQSCAWQRQPRVRAYAGPCVLWRGCARVCSACVVTVCAQCPSVPVWCSGVSAAGVMSLWGRVHISVRLVWGHVHAHSVCGTCVQVCVCLFMECVCVCVMGRSLCVVWCGVCVCGVCVHPGRCLCKCAPALIVQSTCVFVSKHVCLCRSLFMQDEGESRLSPGAPGDRLAPPPLYAFLVVLWNPGLKRLTVPPELSRKILVHATHLTERELRGREGVSHTPITKHTGDQRWCWNQFLLVHGPTSFSLVPAGRSGPPAGVWQSRTSGPSRVNSLDTWRRCKQRCERRWVVTSGPL